MATEAEIAAARDEVSRMLRDQNCDWPHLEDEPAIRADERRKTAEEIARAIEIAEAKRCPWCQGLPQGTTHDNATHQNTNYCMNRHEWSTRPVWHQPAAMAREIGSPT